MPIDDDEYDRDFESDDDADNGDDPFHPDDSPVIKAAELAALLDIARPLPTTPVAAHPTLGQGAPDTYADIEMMTDPDNDDNNDANGT